MSEAPPDCLLFIFCHGKTDKFGGHFQNEKQWLFILAIDWNHLWRF